MPRLPMKFNRRATKILQNGKKASRKKKNSNPFLCHFIFSHHSLTPNFLIVWAQRPDRSKLSLSLDHSYCILHKVSLDGGGKRVERERDKTETRGNLSNNRAINPRHKSADILDDTYNYASIPLRCLH